MKSRTSSTDKIDWNSPLEKIGPKKTPLTLQKLIDAGIDTIDKLIWILPLRVFPYPQKSDFSKSKINEYFRGSGKIIHVDIKPAYGRRGKGKILLYNGYLIVKDHLSSETLALRWFNLYPTQKKFFETTDHLDFMGIVSDFRSQKQIIAPQIISDPLMSSDYIIDYPTINKISGTFIRKYIERLPAEVWDSIPAVLPALDYDRTFPISKAFKVLHGKISVSDFDPSLKEKAIERLIYEEFVVDQLKILTRRKFLKKASAPILAPRRKIDELTDVLPFKLTDDQQQVFLDTLDDLKSGHPMMRMVQGDVGCGKTVIAYLSSVVAIENKFQACLMCPTETLARQHFQTFSSYGVPIRMALLLGSNKASEKRKILEQLKNGEIDLVIGTHALFQESVVFSKLGLAIIDEQHKFGVEQRLKLIAKGKGVHCLIMSATPIPRTLSLAQYGDLDLSTIRTMPSGRKGIKSRITEKINYEKYLQFVRARLQQGEQAYFVFPAIEEDEVMDLSNVKEGFEKYSKYFKEFKVGMLHGKLKPEEKDEVIKKFERNEFQILISTTVIEVGINVPNASVMSVYSPERFGLSSLHQLRGRVGRGDKPGFFFMVLDKEISMESKERLKVIEDSTDGFKIAEEDLKFRGEGDLFGVDQSGTVSTKKIANIITHQEVFEKVVRDLKDLMERDPKVADPLLEKLAKDQKILDTI